MQDIKSKKGFTIIEVVLVLAIAGLIFLMVFIALPNMQRSQRDTARRQDYAALSANITNYITNNNGKLPGSTTGTTLNAATYINGSGTDSSGSAYKLKAYVLSTNQTSETVQGVGKIGAMTNGDEPKVFVFSHARCGSGTSDPTSTASGVEGSVIPVYDKSSRAFAIFGQLETGTYCQQST